MDILGHEIRKEFEKIIKSNTRKSFEDKYYLTNEIDPSLCLKDEQEDFDVIGCPYDSSYCPDDEDCKKCWNDIINAAKFVGEGILKTIRNSTGLYVNNLTKALDSCIVGREVDDVFCTYIYDHQLNNRWILRYPGATRGSIAVDSDNKIIMISITTNNDLYDLDKAQKIVDEYIGVKLEFKE